MNVTMERDIITRSRLKAARGGGEQVTYDPTTYVRYVCMHHTTLIQSCGLLYL